MPFYEYECSACKYYLEVLQKISEASLKKCPSCGKQTLQRLLSAPVFRLKGSGWYETDFKSDNEQKRNLAGENDKDKESKNETQSTDAKAADTKPAAEPAAKPVAETTSAKSSRRPMASKTKSGKASPAKKSAKSKAPAKKTKRS